MEYKFNVGDFVKCVRRVPNWKHWEPFMDALVEQRVVARINAVNSIGGVVYYFLKGVRYMPQSSLALAIVEEIPPAVPRVSVDLQLHAFREGYIQFLVDNKEHQLGVSSLRVYTQTGENVEEHKHDSVICHSVMNRHSGSKIVAIVENLASTPYFWKGGNHCEQDYSEIVPEMEIVYGSFVDYILNRSPVSNAFLTKNAQDAITNGCWLNCEKGTNELIVAQVMLRMGKEGYMDLRMFQRMKELGYSENIAFLMGTMFHPTKNGTWHLQDPDRHCMIAGNHLTSALKKFFSPGFKYQKEPSVKEKAYRYTILQTVGNYSYGAIESIRERLKSITSGERAFGQGGALKEDKLLLAANYLQAFIEEKEEAHA